MPTDYQRQAPQPAAKKMDGMLWLFIGLLLGLVIGGIFYLKNHAPAPTVIPAPIAEANAPIATTPSPAKAKQQLQTQFDFYQVLPSQKVTGPTGDEDTTDMSPPPTAPPASTLSTNMVPPTTSTQSANTATVASPAATPTALPTTSQMITKASPPTETTSPSTLAAKPAHQPKPKKSSNSVIFPKKASVLQGSAYHIQVGVFKDFTNADQLKAQLILAGLNVHISPMQKNGAVLQQVWIGPYSSMSAVKIAQQQLPAALQPGKLLQNP